jgi:hypothetical protein
MRFMVLGKGDTTDAPLPQGIALGPTRTRVTFTAGEPTAIENVPSGAHAVGTFTIIDVESKQDAIEWVKRLPRRSGDEEIEIREGGCPGGVPAVSLSTAPRSGSEKRFVVMLKADPHTETGRIAEESRLRAMVKQNEASVKAGVMLAGEGLQPSSRGARVKFSGGKATIIDGPFAEAKELVAGFWLIQAKSKEEALEWVKAYPFPFLDAEVEVREVIDVQVSSLKFQGSLS